MYPYGKLLCLSVWLVACGSEPGLEAPRSTRRPFTTSTSTGAGGGDSSGDGGNGGAGPRLRSLGALELSEITDTPCRSTSAEPVLLYPAGENSPPLDHLARVGNRRVAWGSWSNGFVTFDRDGRHPSEPAIAIAPSYNLASSEGDKVGTAGVLDSGAIVYQRYSLDDEPLGGPIILGFDAPTGLALGGGEGEAFVVWGAPGVMKACGVDALGAASPPFEFGKDSVASYFNAAVTRSLDGFAIAWTGEPAPGVYTTWFVEATRTGLSAPIVSVVSAPTPHRVVGLERTSSGYALLLDATFEAHAPVLIALDSSGHPSGAARWIAGARFAWGVASLGSEIGLVARRWSGEAEFRALDAEGVPIGPWICLTEPSDAIDHSAAISGDEDGYAVIARTPTGAESLFRLDSFGSPAP